MAWIQNESLYVNLCGEKESAPMWKVNVGWTESVVMRNLINSEKRRKIIDNDGVR